MKIMIVAISLSLFFSANVWPHSATEKEQGNWVSCIGNDECVEINLNKVFKVIVWTNTIMFIEGGITYNNINKTRDYTQYSCPKSKFRKGRHCLNNLMSKE